MANSDPEFFVLEDPTTRQFMVVQRNPDGREVVLDRYDSESRAYEAVNALSAPKIDRS
ncbi:MAG TPA: hypothetical protein VMF12_15245 [Xanthobacteraceae bacterium]|nr:hypothetical protein [Xanthobacteraceae bacterium]